MTTYNEDNMEKKDDSQIQESNLLQMVIPNKPLKEAPELEDMIKE